MRKSISKKKQIKVFKRDRWICRYCGVEVFFSPALKALEELSPDHGYYHRNGRRDRMSKHLLDRCAAVDHIYPISIGGNNDLDNLICACWNCNTTKGNESPEKWISEIIEIEDLDTDHNWDGFSSILAELQPKSKWNKYL